MGRPQQADCLLCLESWLGDDAVAASSQNKLGEETTSPFLGQCQVAGQRAAWSLSPGQGTRVEVFTLTLVEGERGTHWVSACFTVQCSTSSVVFVYTG